MKDFMKYCRSCRRLTSGEPLFCTTCGKSYNLRLCRKLHANPRNARVCAKCGSKDLSVPQPALSLQGAFVRVTLLLVVSTVLLVGTVILLIASGRALLLGEALGPYMLVGLLVALAWLAVTAVRR